MIYRLIHAATGRVIAGKVVKAESFWQRGVGLIGRRPAHGEGLWLPATRSIHTFGMIVPIDVIFLTADYHCAGIAHRLGPCRLKVGPVDTVHTIELYAGVLDEFGKVSVGDAILLTPPG